jgi:hypothetical protein
MTPSTTIGEDSMRPARPIWYTHFIFSWATFCRVICVRAECRCER